MFLPPTTEEEPPVIQKAVSVNEQKLPENNESQISIPKIDSKDKSSPKWISLGFAKFGDAVRSKDSPSNIPSKVDTRKPYRKDAFKDAGNMSNIEKSEIWVDVNNSKISFA